MTSNSSLEIMPKGVSKGKTLRQAYPNEEIYAIGDSENDQSVLDIANQSYDVGTGTLVADFHVSGIDQALAMIAGGIA